MTDEERDLILNSPSKVTWPADHPLWPVSCGTCGERCLGCQAVFHNNATNRACGVTLWVCRSCMRYGATESEKWSEEDFSVIKPRLAVVNDPWLFLAGKVWSEKTGRRLPADEIEAGENRKEA